jgi:hypothetical protein
MPTTVYLGKSIAAHSDIELRTFNYSELTGAHLSPL